METCGPIINPAKSAHPQIPALNKTREALVREITLALAVGREQLLATLPEADLPPSWLLARRLGF